MPGVVLRAGRPDDRAGVDRLTDLAFSSDPRPQRVEAENDHPDHPDHPVDPDVLVRVAERESDGELVASASVRLGGQWWGGRRVPAASLSGVAVDLTARGGGLGTALLADVFGAARAAGALVVPLIPSTHLFYRRSGCGIAGRRPVFSIPTHHLRDLPRGARDLVLRRATGSDTAAVAGLVDLRSARGNGGLEHHGATGAALEFVAERDGIVVGWCALSRRPAQQGLYTVHVHDLVGVDPAVELALWRDLVADTPSARLVVALLPAGSVLEHHLERQTEPIENSSWMLGLLDVPGALAARGYPAGVRARVRFDVLDEPGKDPSCVLEVADGVGRVVEPAGAELTVAVGRGELASLYAGYLDPLTARHAGLLDTTEEGAALLRTLFAGPPAVLHRPF